MINQLLLVILKGVNKHKTHNSTFKNVSSEILKNSFLGPRFNKKRRSSRKKRNSSIDSNPNNPNENNLTSVVMEGENQIINLKAPGQFEKDYNSQNNSQPLNHSPKKEPDPAQPNFVSAKSSPKRGKFKKKYGASGIRTHKSTKSKDYLASFSYFGSRIHDKINEFNKMHGMNVQGGYTPGYQGHKKNNSQHEFSGDFGYASHPHDK